MSPQHSQYQAYSVATRTVAKTRQVVMLYDGAIRFLKQAIVAISEKRIEDRFKLLLKASEVMKGLQNSIDFDKGGNIAHVLLRFYADMSMRILGVNFAREEGKALCEGIINDLKQMRDVWDTIDQTLSKQGSEDGNSSAPASLAPPAGTPQDTGSGGITISA